MRIEDFLKQENCINEFQKRGIAVRYGGPYVLLKYKNIYAGGEQCVDFTDEAIKECRGIIVKKTEKGYEIVCRPFKKWFNFQEPLADEIDWASARVQEKIDGSLVKLWHDDGWHWSTMGTIDAADAETGTLEKLTYMDIILKTDNYKDVPFETLDKELTYLFELVSPYNQIVIKYEKPYLYHIGTRDRAGEEYDINIGIEKPKEYALHSLEDCIKAAEALNEKGVTEEGYVVVDKNWNRIKIKSPKYVVYHRMWNNGAVKPEDVIEIINNGKMREAMEEYPLLREELLRWNAAMAIFEYEVEAEIRKARQIYDEYQDRAVAANYIKKFKYPFAGFWGLDHDGCAKDMINSMGKRAYIQRIKNDLPN